ncbi:hypothetical protein [Kutzneria chonburiensis]|uniref:Uncharacterized protein n=1 Tax=Kutzneria chonburiensis TaxID=1483604 RepID=A0ABV6MX43_9PSEU|nr:hypothetical protein [Kutzneria chonburiensis]
MTVFPAPVPSALARWWWRTPVWSRLLVSLGGGVTAFMIITGLVAPTAPARQPGTPQPVVAVTSTAATTTTATSSETPTTVTTSESVTTELPITMTTKQAPPPTTHQPPPVTHVTTTTTVTPAPPPSEPAYVTAGAPCSPEGATGVTASGQPMVCSRGLLDSRLLWRAA